MEIGKIKRPKRFYKDVGLISDPNKIKKGKAKKNRQVKDEEFVKDLEERANKEPKKRFKFGKVMCEELAYYIDKYGDDYEAMARDRRNVYQDSPGQIRAKIKKQTAIEKRRQETQQKS